MQVRLQDYYLQVAIKEACGSLRATLTLHHSLVGYLFINLFILSHMVSFIPVELAHYVPLETVSLQCASHIHVPYMYIYRCN